MPERKFVMAVRADVAKLIQSEYLVDRMMVAAFHDLFEEEYALLAEDPEADVREMVANKALPQGALLKLQEDPSPKVRAAALSNARTDFQTFRDAVMGSALSNTQKRALCNSLHVVKDAEVFAALWDIKNYDYLLLNRFRWAAQEKRPLTGGPAALWGIKHHEYPLLDRGEEHRNVDGDIFQFLEDHILAASKEAREHYAFRLNTWTNPATLDAMKYDPYRPVINELAKNPRVWVSTHDYLVTKHKTPAIRISIAGVTTSNELLNRIYSGTKSIDICAAVEKNPVFALM